MQKDLLKIFEKYNNLIMLSNDINNISKTLKIVYSNAPSDGDLYFLETLITLLRHKTTSLINTVESFEIKFIKTAYKLSPIT